MLLWLTVGAIFVVGIYMVFVHDSGGPADGADVLEGTTMTAVEPRPRAKQTAKAAATGAESEGLPLPIYFGSQTGTAEMLAQRLAEDAPKHGFAGRAVDLDGVSPDDLAAGGRAVVLAATYGEGDPTDNAADFVQALQEAATMGQQPLNGVPFAVFGLGNTQYEHFNAAGRAINAGLAAAGGERAAPYGEGDDAGTLEDDFEEWCDALWPALRVALLGEEGEEGEEDGPPPCPAPKLRLCYLAAAPEPTPVPRAARKAGLRPTVPREPVDPRVRLDFTARHYLQARRVAVLRKCELRSPGAQGSTLHVELDVGDRGIRYRAADVLAVLPENEPGPVSRLAARLGVSEDAWFTLREWDEGQPPSADDEGGQEEADSGQYPRQPPFPLPCSVREALAQYCDLAAAPRREVFALLAHYATDERERERLFLLASRAGADEYREWVTVPKRGILHVLDAFPSATPPLGAFLHVVGRLQPRLYTIASSPLAHPRLAHVVASVVREEQPCGGEHRGVCTNYFARLHPALPADCGDGAAPGRMGGDVADLQAAKQLPAPDAVRVVFKKSTFSQPPPGAPLLLVGTGTGIAPLRAFLQHRAMQRHEMRVAAGNTAVGPIHLFFGCRHQRGDYLYADEYAQLQEEGVLTSLHTAFSRDGPERPYVQHRLAGQGRLVCDALLLQSRGYMFVCGGTGMGRDVQQTVEQIFCEHGGMAAEEATEKLQELRRHGRYVAELWS